MLFVYGFYDVLVCWYYVDFVEIDEVFVIVYYFGYVVLEFFFVVDCIEKCVWIGYCGGWEVFFDDCVVVGCCMCECMYDDVLYV